MMKNFLTHKLNYQHEMKLAEFGKNQNEIKMFLLSL